MGSWFLTLLCVIVLAMNTSYLPLFRPKKWIIISLLTVGIILIYLFAHWFLLKKTNEYLATFSPVYSGHIDDFELRWWRGSYGFENLTLTLREKPIRFVDASDINVAIDWTELFQGRIRTDVRVTGLKLLYSDYVITQIAQAPAENAEQAKSAGKALFPISVEKIVVRRSTIASADFFGVTDKLPVVVDDISAEVTNLTPIEQRQVSYFKLEGELNGSAPLELSGNFNYFAKPIDWKAKVMAKNFVLSTTNPWMYQVAPLSFQKGNLTLYAEAKATAGRIIGYAKPFAKDVEMVGDERDFKGFTQFGIEIGLAAMNAVFKNAENQTVATKVDFTVENGKFDWNFWKALNELFKNGYKEKLPEGFDE